MADLIEFLGGGKSNKSINDSYNQILKALEKSQMRGQEKVRRSGEAQVREGEANIKNALMKQGIDPNSAIGQALITKQKATQQRGIREGEETIREKAEAKGVEIESARAKEQLQAKKDRDMMNKILLGNIMGGLGSITGTLSLPDMLANLGTLGIPEIPEDELSLN